MHLDARSPVLRRLAVLGLRHAAFEYTLGPVPPGTTVHYTNARTGTLEVHGSCTRELLTRILSALSTAEVLPFPSSEEDTHGV